MDEKLRDILQQVFELFKRYGLRSLSMEDICRELKISKKTLYQYVENKTELIDLVLQWHCETSRVMFTKAEYEKLNAIDVILAVSEHVSANSKLMEHAMFFDLQKYYPEIFQKYWDVKKQEIREHVVQNIEKGIGEGIYRSDLNVQLTAIMYTRRLGDFQDAARELSQNYSMKEIFTAMFEEFIRSIANETGLKHFEEQRKKLSFYAELK